MSYSVTENIDNPDYLSLLLGAQLIHIDKIGNITLPDLDVS